MVCRWVISSAAPNATPLSSEPPHTGKSAGSTAALSQYYVSQLSEAGRLSRRSSGTLLERWGLDFVHERCARERRLRLALADLSRATANQCKPFDSRQGVFAKEADNLCP